MTAGSDVDNAPQELIVSCIDKGLSVLGESGRRALYFHIESKFGVTKDDIPEKPQEFVSALRTLFGEGATILEVAIAREIRSNIFRLSDRGLIEVAEEAVNQLLSLDYSE